MRQSKYLYGDLYDAPILKDMKYPEGLLQKIVWSKSLTDELLQVALYDRDFTRINHVAEAIKFNTNLYDEMYFNMEGLS